MEESKKENIALERLTLEEKVGQMLMFAFHGTQYNSQLDFLVNDLKVGGIIHFARNITSPEQACKLNYDLQKSTSIPLFIGCDQEGGTVQRIIKGVTPFPGAMALSATAEEISKLTYYAGLDLKNMNYNMVFAPVADVNNNPLNPVINSRSYSDNPKVVAKYVIEAFKGFQEAKVLPTAKHFPGHGDTSVDSHISLPTVNKSINSLKKIEFYPFIEAVKAGLDGIMVSHIMYPAIDEKYPATLSYHIMTKSLKEEIEFGGMIVSDSLTMGAINNNFSKKEVVTLAVNGGMDLLIFCGKADVVEQQQIYNIFLECVKSGEISINRVDESVSKILKYKSIYCCEPVKQYVYPVEEAVELGTSLSEKSITLVKDNNLFPITNDDKVLVIFPKIKLFSLVDNADDKTTTLGNVFHKQGYEVSEMIISDELQNFSEIKKMMAEFTKIIFATYNVIEGDYQTKVFSILDKNKTVVVSMRSPYDIRFLSGVAGYVCIYEASDLALNSFVKVALGKKKLIGKIPVKLD